MTDGEIRDLLRLIPAVMAGRATAGLVFGDGQTIPIARRQVNELGRRLGV